MDHKFLWCATSIVLNKMMHDSLECSLQSKICISQAEVHHNDYKYNVMIDDDVYNFTYTFESNTFVSGSLVINDQSLVDSRSKYVVRRCGDSIRIYKSLTDYTELHDYNNTHIIVVHVVRGKKVAIDSVVISNREYTSVEECCDVNVFSYQISKTPPNAKQLHFDLFAVSGALDNFSTTCTDVVTVKTDRLKMSLYNDVSTNIIIVDTFPKWGNEKSVGRLITVNSDFKQEYEYTIDKLTNSYDVTEYVYDRNNQRMEKRHFVYREADGVITIPDYNYTFNIHTDDTDIRFVRC